MVKASTTPMSGAESKQKGIAALVNDKPLLWSDITSDPVSSELYQKARHSKNELLLKFVLQEAIDRELVIQDAEASGYRVPQSDLDERVNYGVKGFGGNNDAFAENLKENGSSLEQFTEQNRRSEIYEHMFVLKVDGPTKTYLRDHPPTVAAGASPEDTKKADDALFQTESTKIENDWMASLRAKAVIQTFDDPTTDKKSDTGIQSPDLYAQLVTAVQNGDAAAVQKLIAEGVDPKTIHPAYPDHLSRAYPTLLFVAGSAQVAELLIQHGVDPKAKDESGDTALHVLGNWNNEVNPRAAEVARVLLQHGAEVNAIGDGWWKLTPIMTAHDGATVDVLVKFGADLRVTDRLGHGVFGPTPGCGDASYFQALVRHGAPFDPEKDGPTLMLKAAQNDRLDVMQWLIDQKVNPNLAGEDVNLVEIPKLTPFIPSTTLPLDSAVAAHHDEAVKFLLNHGAKAYISTMASALEEGESSIVKLLWNHGPRYCSELAYDISQDEPVGKLQELLDHGMPADPPEDREIRPLGIAAQKGDMEAAQLLVKRGAELNPSNRIYNPLNWAAQEEHPDMVAYLLKCGVRPDFLAVNNAIANGGINPGYPRKQGTEKTIAALIQAGAFRGISEDQAAGYLLGAFISKNPVTLKQLLDAGLSPRSKRSEPPDDQGKTALETIRQWYAKIAAEPEANDFKPLLDMLEAADNGAASKPDASVSPTSAPPSIADQRFDELHNDLRIEVPVVKDMPLDQFVEMLRQKLQAQDPQKQGFSFILHIPPGERPLRVSLNFTKIPAYRASAHMILEDLKHRYPIRYKEDDSSVIYVLQLSNDEIAFNKKAEETKISFDFDHTEASIALAAIQAAAAAKGFALKLEGIDSIKTLDAMPAHHAQPITLKANSVSVEQALRSVFYLADLQPTPLDTFTGYKVTPGSPEDLRKQVCVEVGFEVIDQKVLVAENDKKNAILQVHLNFTASPTLRLLANQTGAVGIMVEGANSQEKCPLNFTITPKVTDKSRLQLSSTVELQSPDGHLIEKVTGQWTKPPGTPVRLTSHGGEPVVVLPQTRFSPVPPVGTDVNTGYVVYVTASLVDKDGNLLLPPTYKRVEDADEHAELTSVAAKDDGDATPNASAATIKPLPDLLEAADKSGHANASPAPKP